MADRYLTFSASGPGRFLTRRLGLPQPVPLRRWSPERPELDGPLLRPAIGGASRTPLPLPPGRETHTSPQEGIRYGAVLLDASGVRSPAGLREVHGALHPVMRSLTTHARVIAVGARPDPDDHHQAAAQQALDGFVRSLGKELGKGRTAQLVRLGTGAGASFATESTLRFLLSPKSAFISGQTIEVDAADAADTSAPADWDRPQEGRTVLVTGCARGIGASVAETLARDGAHVVCLDVPQAREELTRLAERLGGTALPLDITSPDAGTRIADVLPDGLDVLVHNAGITRDRRLANMDADRWEQVLDVNLASVLRTTDELLAGKTLKRGGSIVATASISGIAGNVGQTNYAASKAGIIGLVRSLAPRAYAEHGITVNAVAPGFIETRMTAAVPLFIREAGRRMNSLSQGGLPVDVAETTAWLANPASGGVNGQTVRVCGQSLLGA